MAYTRTSGPYNSTPFSSCCGIASQDSSGRPAGRCPSCGEEMTHHDDGLHSRRREVGHGNCLMCAKPVGNPAISGNCYC